MCDLPVFGSLSTMKDIVLQHDIDEIVIAMPQAPGRVRPGGGAGGLAAGAKTRTIPGMYRHPVRPSHRGVAPRGGDPGPPPARPDPDRSRPGAVAGHRRDGARHRRGRIDRQRALPPAGAAGAARNCCCWVMARTRSSTSSWSSTSGTPTSPACPVIADVRDRERMRQIFETYRPYSVFHAAAHKHVPLMESNTSEAITNNVTRHAERRRPRRRARGGAPRADLDRQGGPSDERDGRDEARRRADRPGGRGDQRAELRGGAVRQRARQPRQRRADLPPPDPERAVRSR